VFVEGEGEFDSLEDALRHGIPVRAVPSDWRRLENHLDSAVYSMGPSGHVIVDWGNFAYLYLDQDAAGYIHPYSKLFQSWSGDGGELLADWDEFQRYIGRRLGRLEEASATSLASLDRVLRSTDKSQEVVRRGVVAFVAHALTNDMGAKVVFVEERGFRAPEIHGVNGNICLTDLVLAWANSKRKARLENVVESWVRYKKWMGK
jgi:hypothetical protein